MVLSKIWHSLKKTGTSGLVSLNIGGFDVALDIRINPFQWHTWEAFTAKMGAHFADAGFTAGPLFIRVTYDRVF